MVPLPIFNIMEFLRLVTLCCEGKSDIAETLAQESILTFKMALKIIKQVDSAGIMTDANGKPLPANKLVPSTSFWPLKTRILNYVIHTFLDSNEKDFLVPKQEPETEGLDEENLPSAKDEGPSVVETVLNFIGMINDDCELFLTGKTENRENCQTLLFFPNETCKPMLDEFEEYIYQACMDFIKYVLRRKMHHEFGNRELLFYDTGRHIASLYKKIRPDSKHRARY